MAVCSADDFHDRWFYLVCFVVMFDLVFPFSFVRKSQVDRLFKDEASEEKGERARMVSFDCNRLSRDSW